MTDSSVYIVSARRTPIGSFQGALGSLAAPKLGAVAISAALSSSRVQPEAVDAIYIGNVLSAGIGQAPARQAALAAGLPASVPTATVNKVCGSGLEALILGARAILCGDAEIVVGGGMESMSQAPYYMPGARSGLRMGNAALIDGMIFDGLWDPYRNQHMGLLGEMCAKTYDISRQAQDEFAKQSYQRSLEATEKGLFEREIAPVEISEKKGQVTTVRVDEEPGRGKLDKFAELRPAFDKEGTITAANASSINDGAAALVLASGRKVKELDLAPLARIVGYAAFSGPPEWFTTAPAGAIDKLLQKTGHKPKDIDLYEINEAFSCVPLACARLSHLPEERINLRGGAVALGHPIGASGARIVTTLAHALVQEKKRLGVAGICIGGGEALALLIESCAS
jgi:acetyl-CoA C-acetyltransferase